MQEHDKSRGRLYVVATPIGNLSDMPPRGVAALEEADLILAEDTRVTARLLSHFQVKKPTLSYHKFNEKKRTEDLTARLLEGQVLALVSDAGTPCISDPGFYLIREAVEQGVPVVGTCGPSAVTTALSVSGFDCASFSFYGFPPREAGSLGERLEAVRGDSSNVAVFYESPLRIRETLARLAEFFPHGKICLCNDLSKRYERIYRGSPEEVRMELEQNPSSHKGEYTLVLEKNTREEPPTPGEPPVPEALLVEAMVRHQLTLKEAVAMLKDQKDQSLGRRELYAASLRLKELLTREVDR